MKPSLALSSLLPFVLLLPGCLNLAPPTGLASPNQQSPPPPSRSQEPSEVAATPAVVSPIVVSPRSTSSIPAARLPSSQNSQLSIAANQNILRLLPKERGRPVVRSNKVFSKYPSPRAPKIEWGKGWTAKVDFSGVAWDIRQTVTMISPQHGVMAKHFRRKPNTNVVFHGRDGKKVTRKIIGVRSPADIDIAICLLDKPVTDKVRKYRLLAPSPNYTTSLPGAGVLVTNQFREVHVHQVRMLNAKYRTVGYMKSPLLPEGYFKRLVKGDSGNPTFLWLRGEPIFIATHYGGGAGSGPFLGYPKTIADINAAMRLVSEVYSQPIYKVNTVAP